MKTTKFISAISILSFVIFMSLASLASSAVVNSGDLTKSGNKSMAITISSEMDINYLRFDVTKYSSENEAADLIHNSLDYLRFDVNDYIIENDTESMDLPVSIEFEYLRFNVNNFTECNPGDLSDLPSDEFNYLRFDVNKFARAHFQGGGHANAAGGMSELPMDKTIEKFLGLLPDYKQALNSKK